MLTIRPIFRRVSISQCKGGIVIHKYRGHSTIHNIIKGNRRCYSSGPNSDSINEKHKKVAYIAAAFVVFTFGVSYASVPLYKVFCQMTGFGGTTQRADEAKANTVKPVVGGRVIRVDFDGSVHSTLPWKFRPTQSNVKLVPGETALAFYTVKNTTNKPITGVATYNVFPPKAGIYFNKIQCFCFEEQRIGPHEEIDMPVFFFIDPEFADDPSMDNVKIITLSYTFFKTNDSDDDEEEEETKESPSKAVSSEQEKNIVDKQNS
mmetsp:Transcript_351/g.644  ORF Transcript_351/g.644 Transcript_351/m.644 type:complete len:262 (-) Transcript_351:85-870(-)